MNSCMILGQNPANEATERLAQSGSKTTAIHCKECAITVII